MSWQDEQRKLSEELSRGEISAEEYRARRDQLLAAANPAANPAMNSAVNPSLTSGLNSQPNPAAGPMAPQPGQGPVDATQTLRPVGYPDPGGQQSAQQPGPAAPGGDPAADRTQAISPQQMVAGGGSADAERTQAVAMPGGGSDPERTQTVAMGGRRAGGAKQQAQQDSDDEPLWGGAEFPPLVSSGSSDWLKQGPEVFAPANEQKPKKGKIIMVVAAVVVLAAIAFGAYWLWGRGGGAKNNNDHPAQPNPSSSSAPAPADPLAIGTLPCDASPTDIPDAKTTFPKTKAFLPAELKAYDDAGITKARVEQCQLGDGSKVIIVAAEVDNANKAEIAASQLQGVQLQNKNVAVPGTPAGVKEAKIDKNGAGMAQIRAHYVHEDVVERIEVQGKTPAAAAKDFKTVLDAELKASPANG
ncbi:MAG: hypothetical protein J2O49_08400 [Sciscionella sp.]|nr:hypothetical protein [Sciscionella sp.]